MARKPRAPKREPAHKTDGDGMELTAGDGGQSTTVESEIHMLSLDDMGRSRFVLSTEVSFIHGQPRDTSRGSERRPETWCRKGLHYAPIVRMKIIQNQSCGIRILSPRK